MSPLPQDLFHCLAREERGVATVFNLFMTMACCMIGAVALDVTHSYDARSQLQISADLAAHAALYTRRYGAHEDRGSGSHYYPFDNATAEAAAIAAVKFGTPGEYGEVITADDILIGRYDHVSGRVYVDPDEPDAAEAAAVLTHRTGTDSVRTLLFRMTGIASLDVSAAAVFALGPGECRMDQGLFSEDEIQIQSMSRISAHETDRRIL